MVYYNILVCISFNLYVYKRIKKYIYVPFKLLSLRTAMWPGIMTQNFFPRWFNNKYRNIKKTNIIINKICKFA